MARVKWNTTSMRYISSMWSNTEDWQYIRKTPQLEAMFAEMGQDWVGRLNTELHEAQARRRQPIADGYKFAINRDEDRLRMYIWAYTARAMAHEAAHQSILRLMRTSGFDTNEKGRAKFGGSRRTGGGKGKGRGKGAGSRPRSQPQRPTLDPKRAARMRRQLSTLDRLAEDRGATEAERSLAKERARRLRGELGEG